MNTEVSRSRRPITVQGDFFNQRPLEVTDIMTVCCYQLFSFLLLHSFLTVQSQVRGQRSQVTPVDSVIDSFFRLCCFFSPGLRESMRQAELNNWSLEPTQIADLCSSINQFFARTGVIQPQGAVQPSVCHGSMHPNKPSQHLNTG